MNSDMVTTEDFYPREPVTLEDFYPEGSSKFFHSRNALGTAKRRLGAQSAAVLEALTKRLADTVDVEIELVTIMELCGSILRVQGVDVEKYRAEESVERRIRESARMEQTR